MKNEKSKAGDTKDTKNAGGGTDERANSGKIGVDNKKNGVLDSKTKEKKSNAGSAKTGENANRLIKSFKMGAVIPVMQYGNLQPVFEIEDVGVQEGMDLLMPHIQGLFEKYGEKGGLQAKDAVTVTLKSFNEEGVEDGVEVQFDPIAHTYTYKGTKLIGATNYIKQFFKPFDADKIAPACAKSWGAPEEQIKAMWSTNGSLTSDFGSMVHKALEHYEKHKEMGEKIVEKKGGDNPAMPKHPFLKKIIEEFFALEMVEGEVVPEVLLTDVKGGFCGQADRLVITGPKKCRVQDYKVNVDAEKEDKNSKVLAPWNELLANKLSKYQLQLSVYANMLQRSGWTVEGLDVYVYEEQWRHYELDVLNVLKVLPE